MYYRRILYIAVHKRFRNNNNTQRRCCSFGAQRVHVRPGTGFY